MGDEVFPEDARTERGLSRRKLIQRAAVVGAAAWSAPTIIDSVASPASALTLPPCPLGKAYAIMYSPPGAVDLVDRLPAGNGYGSVQHGNCVNTTPDPLCIPPGGYQRTFAGSISLMVTQRNISHNINEQLNGPQQALNVTLAQNSCCTIENVYAYIHRFGGASAPPDCPPNYCQPAGSTYLPLTVNNTKSWTIQPSSSGALCGGQGVHWGSPNTNSNCVGYNGAGTSVSTGQSFGYLLILLNCTGVGPA